MSTAPTAFWRGLLSAPLPHADSSVRDLELPSGRHCDEEALFSAPDVQMKEASGLAFPSSLRFADSEVLDASPSKEFGLFGSPDSIVGELPVKSAEIRQGQEQIDALLKSSPVPTSLLSSPDGLDEKVDTSIKPQPEKASEGREQWQTKDVWGSNAFNVDAEMHTKARGNMREAQNVQEREDVEEMSRKSDAGKQNNNDAGHALGLAGKRSSHSPSAGRRADRGLSKRLFTTIGLNAMKLSDTGPSSVVERLKQDLAPKGKTKGLVSQLKSDEEASSDDRDSSEAHETFEYRERRSTSRGKRRAESDSDPSDSDSSSSSDESDESGWEVEKRSSLPPPAPTKSKPRKLSMARKDSEKLTPKRERGNNAANRHVPRIVQMSSGTAASIVGKEKATFAEAFATLERQCPEKRKRGRPSKIEIQQRRKVEEKRLKLRREMQAIEARLGQKVQPNIKDLNHVDSALEDSSSSGSSSSSDANSGSSSDSSDDEEGLRSGRGVVRRKSPAKQPRGGTVQAPTPNAEGPKRGRPKRAVKSAPKASTTAPEQNLTLSGKGLLPVKRQRGRPRKNSPKDTSTVPHGSGTDKVAAASTAGKSIPLLLGKRRRREREEREERESREDAEETWGKKRRGRPPKVAKKGVAVVNMAKRVALGDEQQRRSSLSGTPRRGRPRGIESLVGKSRDNESDGRHQDISRGLHTKRNREDKGRKGMSSGRDGNSNSHTPSHSHSGVGSDAHTAASPTHGKTEAAHLAATIEQKDAQITYLRQRLDEAHEQLEMESSRALELEEAMGLGIPMGTADASAAELERVAAALAEREREVAELQRAAAAADDVRREKEAALRGFVAAVKELEAEVEAGRARAGEPEVRRLEAEVEMLKTAVKNAAEENRELQQRLSAACGA